MGSDSTKGREALIKNGKFYVAPEVSNDDFQDVLMALIAVGAGLPVDGDGFPIGSWRPETLASAICETDSNGSGIELRTVQNWFQKNDKGISHENVRRLARVFGCGDPELTTTWLSELSAARRRHLARRQGNKKLIKKDQGARKPMERSWSIARR